MVKVADEEDSEERRKDVEEQEAQSTSFTSTNVRIRFYRHHCPEPAQAPAVSRPAKGKSQLS